MADIHAENVQNFKWLFPFVLPANGGYLSSIGPLHLWEQSLKADAKSQFDYFPDGFAVLLSATALPIL